MMALCIVCLFVLVMFAWLVVIAICREAGDADERTERAFRKWVGQYKTTLDGKR